MRRRTHTWLGGDYRARPATSTLNIVERNMKKRAPPFRQRKAKRASIIKKHKDKRKTASYSEAAPSVATNSHLAWWDRSLPPPVADTGMRSVGNRKERWYIATMRVPRVIQTLDPARKSNKKNDRIFPIVWCRVTRPTVLVGSIGLEPTTSTMSTWRSDQLS